MHLKYYVFSIFFEIDKLVKRERGILYVIRDIGHRAHEFDIIG